MTTTALVDLDVTDYPDLTPVQLATEGRWALWATPPAAPAAAYLTGTLDDLEAFAARIATTVHRLRGQQ